MGKVTNLNLGGKQQKEKERLDNNGHISNSHNQKVMQSPKLSSVLINLAGNNKNEINSAHKRDEFRKKTVTRLMKQMGQF